MARRLTPLLLLCVALAPGCGGETDAAPTRQEFIAQGDAICERVDAQLVELSRRVQERSDAAAGPEEALERSGPLLAEAGELQREYVAELRDLTPPAGDEETVDELLTSMEEQTEHLVRLADAAEDGDGRRYGQIAPRASEGRDRAQALLQGYGFQKCGSGDREAE